MDTLLFFLISTLEHSSLFIMILALFRFNIKSNIIQIFIFSLIPTTISYIFIVFGLHEIASGFQIASVILIFIFGFKEKILYSIWITISGYFIFAIVQSIIIGMLIYSKFATIVDLGEPLSPKQRITQIISILVVYSISYVLKKTNDGFAFTLNEKRIKTSKYLYIGFSFLAITVFILMTFIVFSNLTYLIYFIGLSSLALLITIIILIMSIIQNRKFIDYQFDRFTNNYRKENINE